jgi:hypothetical protein
MSAIHIDGHTVAMVRCESGDFQADAHDSAEVQSVLADAAMHAMSTGHTVVEHVASDRTVRPAP